MHSTALLYDEKEHPVLVNSLVNFQQKAIDRINEDRLKVPSEPEEDFPENEEDWTEFTDSLGRTRRCLKSDLPDFMARDTELNQNVPLSADEKLRLLKHERWEKEAAETANKSHVHYQDVLYDGKHLCWSFQESLVTYISAASVCILRSQ